MLRHWKAGTFGLVRTAHLEYVAGASGAYIVNSALDADLGGNQVHYTFASHKRQAMRWAEWLIRAATGTLTTMQGPVITSATRAGATVTVNVTQHGGTSLVDGAGGSGSALAGFRVYDGASLMTISSTSISGNTITLNLSATPSGAVTMDFAMKNFAFDADPPVAASIVCDNEHPRRNAWHTPQPSLYHCNLRNPILQLPNLERTCPDRRSTRLPTPPMSPPPPSTCRQWIQRIC